MPRVDVVFLSLDQDIQQLVEKMSSSGHSRIPIYKDTIDTVIGIIYAKDTLQYAVRGAATSIDQLVRKPYFVPESKRLDALLREMQKRQVHIAIVVDEYGGVSGIVCMEDIIEEIVGEIQDEFDNEQEDIRQVSQFVYLCDARADIQEINTKLKLSLPQENFDTLGGFVFDLFGKVPSRYEQVAHENVDFIIESMRGHKIESVKVLLHPPAPDTASEQQQ